MELLVLILVLSFIFSFGIFLLGVFRKDYIFSIFGSLLLMIFSLVCIIIGVLGTGAESTTFSDGIINKTFTVTEGDRIDNTITLAFGIIAFIFSALLMLYSAWSQKNRNSGDDDE